jgi:hypothetical protein
MPQDFAHWCGRVLGSHALRHFLSRPTLGRGGTDSFRHEGKTDRIRQALVNGPR